LCLSSIAALFRASTPRLLIVGCGDVGMRVLKALRRRCPVWALTSNPSRLALLRTAGATPLLGDLDDPGTLARLAALPTHVLHLAPPASQGHTDHRTLSLLHALARGGTVQRIVYASTTGVYGDAQGARFDEVRALAPATDRARRRVDAEAQLRRFGRAHGVTVSLLRVPGIYAFDREGGDPRERLHRGAPLLAPQDDVHTNHIHADDLARACLSALWRGAPQRAYHINDDSQLTMGEHFDAVADACGLPRAPRLSRIEMAERVSPMQMSFMSESRQLINARMKRELRLRLRYPTVLAAMEELP
jgi:nucleoside-diphosphate-sugar epimerase